MEIRPANNTRMAPRSLPNTPAGTSGGFTELDGELHYRITSYHRMPPFFISIPSDTDLWMFIASGGGLTAGRVDAEGSLFPYRTVDQLHEAHHHTGPVTLLKIQREDGTTDLWEPFAATNGEDPAISRTLLKNTTGNRLIFEESNLELDLVFRYVWSACEEFGWVRCATLENTGSAGVRIDLLDGFRNILPYGAPLNLYQQAGNLVDAYKKSEVDSETGLGIYSLTAGITDRAEALEVLRANTVWCCGLDEFKVHLSLDTVEAFRRGRVLTEDHLLDGARGNYLVSGNVELDPGHSSTWYLMGDTGRDHMQIAELRQQILSGDDHSTKISAALSQATINLRKNVASADGLQMSGRPESLTHHFANVLFNNMRGGVFSNNYQLPVADLLDFLTVRNKLVGRRMKKLLGNLPEELSIQELHEQAKLSGDVDFQRLCHEYLPLHFGRRHGDPSRPWNHFSINVKEPNGDRALRYEGNWRDIFQNWEALGTSFPGFLPNLVAKFVNASTVDGFNPYRINRDGVDWEVVKPEDMWSNIGYWGDHQIIYLLKLLEAWKSHDPSGIENVLNESIFSYVDVPYRIKPYDDIVVNPSDTIDFDSEKNQKLTQRVDEFGTDGKLLMDSAGQVHHGNLLEKLLVPALAKLSNLVPDGGIWMNTQRPEWNDANNALAGGGISVVTLCYLRRYLAFLSDLLGDSGHSRLPVANEILVWFMGIESGLEDGRHLLEQGPLTPAKRKALLDSLGHSFSDYRARVYDSGFSGTRDLPVSRVIDLCCTALAIIDQGLEANRRGDGLFHTYNTLEISEDETEAEVLRLQVMLEGQVAILSSGFLTPEEALDIMERLFASDMYRSDQKSFLLYPARKLPGFLTRNTVPENGVKAISLLKQMVKAGDHSLVGRDADGIYRFSGSIKSAADLEAAMDNPSWDVSPQDRQAVLDLFEDIFKHKSYTGRSGVMYGYEGLGCIYWHMVAKLLLAVQENVLRARTENSSAPVRHGLERMYFRVRSGLGYEKTAAEFGSFPADPYSHTPSNGGAKQPGMTGQVKEEILTRRGELGILVEDGALRFRPSLLRASGLLKETTEFIYFDVKDRTRSLDLDADSMAFTLCQVPVVYEKADQESWIQVCFTEGTDYRAAGHQLDFALSSEIFERSGLIDHIRVGIPADWLGQN